MNLHSFAESDLAHILADGQDAVLIAPTDIEHAVAMLSNDIAEAVDPGTGQIVTGRYVTALLRISTILAAGISLPKGVADTTGKPWRLRYTDLQGVTSTFKIASAKPDRTVGLLKCELQAYVS